MSLFHFPALPDGWFELDSRYQYKLVNMTKTWTDARAHCQSLGGDLVSFSGDMSQTSLKFVYRLFGKNKKELLILNNTQLFKYQYSH